jgi:hypothetical protein
MLFSTENIISHYISICYMENMGSQQFSLGQSLRSKTL